MILIVATGIMDVVSLAASRRRNFHWRLSRHPAHPVFDVCELDN